MPVPVPAAPVLVEDLPPLLVVPWEDPVVDRLGIDPRAEYVEQFWLPLLGPTATWILRRFAEEFDRSPQGFSLSAVEVARAVGVGTRGGRSGPFPRSVDRLVRFGIAQHAEHGILNVRRRVPPLGRSHLNRLPAHRRDAHARWQDDQRSRATHPAGDAHAARLARSLLDVGASSGEVIEQLLRWRFDETAARRALRAALTAAPALSGAS